MTPLTSRPVSSVFTAKQGAILLILGTALTACASPKPPTTAPTTLSAPPALSDDGYVEIIIQEDFPGTAEEVRAYLDTDNKLLFAMPDTDRIARPVSYDLTTSGTWPEAGAERIMKFSDGHYAFERVVSFSAESFSYQVWGFTSGNGKNVDHIYGEQRLVPDPNGGTDFIWTYRVKPSAGWKRPFVRRFVESDVRELLQTATTRVAEQAREEMPK